MADPNRYATIEQLWAARSIPPCTRIEAERASRALVRHFGRKQFGAVEGQLTDMTGPREISRSWISLKGKTTRKGWPDLVHDLSHRIWRRRCPRLKPHTPGHHLLELELAEYVIAKGWLDRALLPPKKAKPTRDQALAAKLAKSERAVKRWESRAKLARTKIRKYKRLVTRTRRELIYATNAPVTPGYGQPGEARV
jgi:hypothetical protein